MQGCNMNGEILNSDNGRLVILILAIWGTMWRSSSGVSSLIERSEMRLSNRTDRLEARMDAEFDKIDSHLDPFGERIAANEASLNARE